MSGHFRWNKDYVLAIVDNHIIDYPSPINLSYAWSFGALAGICLVIQIITGIFYDYEQIGWWSTDEKSLEPTLDIG